MIRSRLLRTIFGICTILGSGLAQSNPDTAFQQAFALDIADSSEFSFTTFVVPHGKRLIIRYLSATATVPTGQRFWSSVQTTAAGNTAAFAQLYAAQDNGDGTDEVVSNQVVTIQADGDTTVYFQLFRRLPKSAVHVIFSISGDLVVMPQ